MAWISPASQKNRSIVNTVSSLGVVWLLTDAPANDRKQSKEESSCWKGGGGEWSLPSSYLQNFQFRELSLAKFQGHGANAHGNSGLLPPHSVSHCVTGIVLLTC